MTAYIEAECLTSTGNELFTDFTELAYTEINLFLPP